MSSRSTPKQEAVHKLAQEVDQHLSVIRQRLREPLETEFARGGLTGPQRMVMQALVQSEGLSLKQLSAQVSLAHSTVSGIVDRLQARGMVVRSRDEADGRATVIAPSGPGPRLPGQSHARTRDQSPHRGTAPRQQQRTGHRASRAEKAARLNRTKSHPALERNF